MRSKKISIFTFILVIVLSFTNTMTAFAGGRSDERTITLKGYTYRFWSVINNPSTGEIFVTVQPCHSYFARIYIMTKNIINWLAKYSCMALSI